MSMSEEEEDDVKSLEDKSPIDRIVLQLYIKF